MSGTNKARRYVDEKDEKPQWLTYMVNIANLAIHSANVFQKANATMLEAYWEMRELIEQTIYNVRRSREAEPSDKYMGALAYIAEQLTKTMVVMFNSNIRIPEEYTEEYAKDIVDHEMNESRDFGLMWLLGFVRLLESLARYLPMELVRRPTAKISQLNYLSQGNYDITDITDITNYEEKHNRMVRTGIPEYFTANEVKSFTMMAQDLATGRAIVEPEDRNDIIDCIIKCNFE